MPPSEQWKFYEAVSFRGKYHLEAIVQYLSALEGDIARRVADAEKEAPDEADNLAHTIHQLSLVPIAREHPRFLRYGAVIAMSAVIDVTLRNACSEVRRVRAIPNAPRMGTDIDRFLAYLEEHVGVDGKVHPLWGTVEKLGDVRHCIAHAAGYVPAMRRPAVVEKSAEALGMGVTGAGQIEIPAGALQAVGESCKSWLFEFCGDVGSTLRS